MIMSARWMMKVSFMVLFVDLCPHHSDSQLVFALSFKWFIANDGCTHRGVNTHRGASIKHILFDILKPSAVIALTFHARYEMLAVREEKNKLKAL